MHPPFKKRIFSVTRAEIGHLRFIVESYEGLVFLRTLDQHQGLVEISYAAERERDVDGLVAGLAKETGWREVTAEYLGIFPEL